MSAFTYSVIALALPLIGSSYNNGAKKIEANISQGVAQHRENMRRLKANYAVFGPFGIADTNRDGKVSLSEKLAVYERIGATNIIFQELSNTQLTSAQLEKTVQNYR